MNKTYTTLLLASIFASTTFISTHVNAVEGLSANAAFTSNYLWRGLEQTNGSSAASGGIDYNANSGFYAGTWVSNADWADGMTYELDLYAGFSGETKSFSYDIGFIQYLYPDSTDDVDFNEVYGSISVGAFTFGYATLAGGEGVDFGDDSYISVDAEFEVAKDLALALHVATGTDEFYAGEEFIDYGVSLSKNGFTFGLSNTDLDNDDLKAYISYSIDIDL